MYRIIEPIVASPGGEDPAYLDTLASAYAEVGAFDEALESARKAMAVLRARRLPEEVVSEFRRNLDSIKAGRPVRQP